MYIRLFVISSSLLLSILPTLNLCFGEQSKDVDLKSQIKNMYSTDVAEGLLNKFLIDISVSMNSNNVVIGYDGWLFLGDGHSKVISNLRDENGKFNELSNDIVLAQEKWKGFYKKKGIKDFKIVVGPNKSTVYEDKLPRWVSDNATPISEALYESEVYINSIKNLRNQKKDAQVYYTTDTHWNEHGAGVAFMQLIGKLKTGKDFVFPSADWNNVISIKATIGGDLARFLKVQEFVHDSDPTIRLNDSSLIHEIIDYKSKDLVYRGESASYGRMDKIYMIRTPNALNQSKVLWLSDSFGYAMAPFMTSTFSHVIKTHWRDTVGNQAVLENLIDEWKPDYVIYTVVERDSLSKQFLILPKES